MNNEEKEEEIREQTIDEVCKWLEENAWVDCKGKKLV